MADKAQSFTMITCNRQVMDSRSVHETSCVSQ